MKVIRQKRSDGSPVAQRIAAVGDGGFSQINNIFSWFAVAPFEGASVHLASAKPFFAYASIVRNDTGDGYLLTGAARDRTANDIVAPACDDPATLNLAVHPAPGYIVVFDAGTDSVARVDALEQKYGFDASDVFPVFETFVVPFLSAETVAALRCESDVQQVDQNAWGELSIRR